MTLDDVKSEKFGVEHSRFPAKAEKFISFPRRPDDETAIYVYIYICNGVEWSKDRTQAAESIKWRPQQAYGSNQVLFAQPQTIFSSPKILTLTQR